MESPRYVDSYLLIILKHQMVLVVGVGSGVAADAVLRGWSKGMPANANYMNTLRGTASYMLHCNAHE